MIRRGSFISDGEIYFKSDKNRNIAAVKSDMRRQERKKAQRMIRKMLESE